ncbi:glucan biosynthesis protein [Nitrosococcus wardiae]|nr:glucan biosynthesis protein G [Nitrosococcus wardiae]
MALAEPKLIPPQNAEISSSPPFDFSVVEKIARQLAAQPYVKNTEMLPESLINLDYDQYRDIRYKPKHTLWQEEELPFQLQFFHRGFMFKDPVKIHIIDKGLSYTVAYANNLFDFGKNQFSETLPSDLGFAGFRIFYPLRKGKELDEIAAFLGASYFRAIGLGQVYGLSARGLAVDTGLTRAEEFPLFKEFWIEKPSKENTKLAVYALLDSPAMTGAYHFIIQPGVKTMLEVTAHLFFRHGVERLGMAPLTSMFFHGENTDYFIDDFRPEVHDSDGLLIGRGNGEWVWRPLSNPRQLQINVFEDTNPIGFGLMQRDRHFEHYQDLESKYHLRPSAWVERLGKWGAGAIYLIEIPSDAEKYDNIIAFWVPKHQLGKDQDWVFKYRLHFLLNNSPEPSGGKVLASRIGGGGTDVLDGKRRKFVVDFASETLHFLSKHAPVEAEISASRGRIINPVVHKNPFTHSWRLSFELEPEAEEEPVNLRAYLKTGTETLSETWIYQWGKP